MKKFKKGFLGILSLLVGVAIISWVVYVYMGKTTGGESGTGMTRQKTVFKSTTSAVDKINQAQQDRMKQAGF